MALTDYDKKNLTQDQQKQVEVATQKWNEANAKGDKAGMAAAAQEAAAVRNAAGYKTDSSGNYSPTSSGVVGASKTTGSSNKTYSPVGTFNDAIVSETDQKMIKYYQQQYADAIARGDRTAAQAAHSAAESIRQGYNFSGGVDGSDYIQLEKAIFEYPEQKPTYNSKYDPQIDKLLSQILNRDDFSYNVANDPLYQQYAQMYQREGDRARKETLADAAAMAGGMNTYAITAAQQANNYYNSQLNDRIPELYQLAYNMYLNDKESMVQDLGLLQNMDNTQYNRYRDTMSDYYADKNFAYGVYRDDVADTQWDKNYNYNAYVDNRNFDFNDYWTEKEFDYRQEQDTITNNRLDRESAEKQLLTIIESGGTPSPELVAQAQWNQSDVDNLVASIKAEKAANLVGKVKDDDDDDDDDNDDNDGKGDETGVLNMESVAKLGAGMLSDETVLQLIEKGAVILNKDGTVEWADGYDENNYYSALYSFSLYPNRVKLH